MICYVVENNLSYFVSYVLYYSVGNVCFANPYHLLFNHD